jgi:hypothetical protein
MPDRRRFARVPLDAPQFVTLRLEGGTAEKVLLIDLGRGGLQISFAPTRDIQGTGFLGRAVSVDALPAALSMEGENLPGIISWVSAQRCGIRLQTPLAVSDAELVIALAAL